MSALKYRPEVDGLRAVAVIPVILFHLGYDTFSGGFVGVDVFFVISGYLITGIIHKGLIEGDFSFVNFWKRRVRRIIPALLAVVAFAIVAGYLLMFRAAWEALGRQSGSALLSIANFEFWRMAGDYWGPDAERSPLLHTWSLSVEEQFYLIYPVIIVLIHKWYSKGLLKIIILGIFLSFTLSCYAGLMHPAAGFYLLPFRAWELMCGGCLAIVVRNSGIGFSHYKWAGIFSWLGIFVLSFSYVFVSSEHQFPGPWGALPVIGTLLILAFAGGGNIVTKLLSARPVVYTGKISYSLYLWHWPVIVFAQYYSEKYQCDPINQLGAIIIFLSLAIISYNLVETPLRKESTQIKWILASAAACLLCSIILIKYQKEYDTSYQNPTVWYGGKYDLTPNQNATGAVIGDRMKGIVFPKRNKQYDLAYAESGIVHPYGEPKVMVFGSSHALMWCGLIDEVCADLKLGVSFFAADATSPFFELPLKSKATYSFSTEDKFLFDQARVKAVKAIQPEVVIVVHKWSGVEKKETKDLLDLLVDNGCRVLLIEEPPRLAIGDVNAPQFIAYLDAPENSVLEKLYVKETNIENHSRGQRMIISIANDREYVDVLPIADLYRNKKGRILARKGKEIIYIDDDHLSAAGASIAKSRFTNYLKQFTN